jgi:hypothetical protein
MQVPETVPDVTSSDLRLELFLRSLAPETARPQQEAVIERHRDFADDEVTETERYVTGDRVCPSTVAAKTETDRFLLDRYAAFNDPRWSDCCVLPSRLRRRAGRDYQVHPAVTASVVSADSYSDGVIE